MTKVLFNKEGAPLLAYGDAFFIKTNGGPSAKVDTSKSIVKLNDITTVGDYQISSWGESNNFPLMAKDIIRKVGVLNTGLKFLRNLTIGQGIFPCNVTGYKDDGSEILKVIDDKKVIDFCQGRLVRRYLEKALRDYLKFGVANANLIANSDGSQIVGIEVINALYSRYTVAKDGVIEKLIVSGRFPDSPGKDYEVFNLLDEYDPFADLERLRMGGKVAGESFAFAIKDSWSNNDYYSEPIWQSAYEAGWIDVAMVVPKFLKKAFENRISKKPHIQIPYAFWDKKFPKEDFKTTDLRTKAIEDYMDAVERNLCGPENAEKPLFTFFDINPQNGKVEEQWIITYLDGTSKSDELITSAAANSEILFSLMINPNVLGAGMPGGTYAGNQGGSNIREAFLVNIANAWIDRQNILDPVELMLQYNGVKDVQLRFGNTILTTLDTGAGTKKTLS